jgi:hypothetical protein
MGDVDRQSEAGLFFAPDAGKIQDRVPGKE